MGEGGNSWLGVDKSSADAIERADLIEFEEVEGEEDEEEEDEE